MRCTMHVYDCRCTYACMELHVALYVCLHGCLYACMYVCMHVCMYVRVHVCTYVLSCLVFSCLVLSCLVLSVMYTCDPVFLSVCLFVLSCPVCLPACMQVHYIVCYVRSLSCAVTRTPNKTCPSTFTVRFSEASLRAEVFWQVPTFQLHDNLSTFWGGCVWCAPKLLCNASSVLEASIALA